MNLQTNASLTSTDIKASLNNGKKFITARKMNKEIVSRSAKLVKSGVIFF